MRFLPVIGIFLPVFAAMGATLHLEGERAWLKAEGTPVSKVLRLFEERGARVLIDPDLDMGRVTGDWENTKVERLIGQLVSPHSYLVEWKKVQGPLGVFYQVDRIKIYGENAAAVEPITKKSRVLDVVEGKDGVRYIRGEIMVGFKEGSTEKDLNALLRKLNGTVVEVINPPGIYRIRLNEGMTVEQAVSIAEAQDGVDSSEPNLAFSNKGAPPVPISGTRAGMNLNLEPGERAIAVFDSGLDPQYADLPFIRGTYDALDPSADMSDPTGHGTLVSLIASGAVTPLGGETPDSGAPVLAVRVFDENGMTSSDTLMRAIDYALGSGVDIINLSFGTYEDVGFLEDTVEYAAKQGIMIFVASGNDGLDVAVNPAANPVTVSVGATDAFGNIAGYSNTAADEFEPGGAPYDGSVHYGTSFASPYAAFKYATRK